MLVFSNPCLLLLLLVLLVWCMVIDPVLGLRWCCFDDVSNCLIKIFRVGLVKFVCLGCILIGSDDECDQRGEHFF